MADRSVKGTVYSCGNLDSADLAEALDEFLVGAGLEGVTFDCLKNTCRELVGAGCRSDHCRGEVTGVGKIFSVRCRRNRSVGIEHIAAFLINMTDLFLHLLFGRKFSAEHVEGTVPVLRGFSRKFLYAVLSASRKARHKVGRLVSGNLVDKSFKVARDQDVHARRACEDKIPVAVVNAAFKEIEKYFIVIRSADEL